MSCDRCLCVSTTGLSRDGSTLKGGIVRITVWKLVDKLVRLHTNLVLRESLDDVLRDLLPWDIEFVIDESVDEKEEEPEA